LLLTLALWTILLAAAKAAGAVVWGAVAAGDELPRAEDRFLAQTWTGLLALASLLLWTSLLVPLMPWGWLVIAAVAGLGFHRAFRGDLPGGAPAKLLALVLGVCALATSGVVMLHDTGLYHYGMLRWLAETGTVPGLELIGYRFGFSSAWFALGAALDAGPWRGRGATAANGLVFALMLYHFLVAWGRARDGTAERADMVALGGYPLVFVVTLMQRMQVSASPNLAVAGGIVVAAWLLAATRGAIPVALGGALLGVKLTALPVLAAALAARRSVGALALAVLLGAPVVVANYVTTGCPLFPSPAICGSDVASQAERETRDWARYVGRLPADGGWARLDWVPAWFRSPSNVAFFAAASAGLLVVARRRAWTAVAGLGAAGWVWVMATVPDYRLGFGYAGALAGAAAAACHRPGTPLRFRLPAVAVVCGLVLLDAVAHEAGYWLVLNDPRGRPRLERLLAPPEILRPPVAPLRVNDVDLVAPASQGGLCWGAPVPCTIQYPHPRLRMCDPSKGIRAGFCR
jgi:hypothetical protein